MIDSYVRIFSLHMQAYVSASYDHRFFSTVSLKYGQLARIFGQMVHRLPLAKNCPHAYASYSRKMTQARFKNPNHSVIIRYMLLLSGDIEINQGPHSSSELLEVRLSRLSLRTLDCRGARNCVCVFVFFFQSCVSSIVWYPQPSHGNQGCCCGFYETKP